jgi:Protein of unknown function (DUF3047)
MSTTASLRLGPLGRALGVWLVGMTLALGWPGQSAGQGSGEGPGNRPSHAAARDASSTPVWLGRFTSGLEPWQEVRFKAELKPNRFRQRIWDGVAALEVVSHGAMSLMAREVMVDLAATPVLCWRWRVDAPLLGADMRTKAGDDYAARVYVSLGLPDSAKSLALRTQLRLARALFGPQVPDAALNYVWDNKHPVGTVRPNAYTDRAIMVVQRSGQQHAGQWVQERRNVARDAQAHFGPGAAVVQLALTADTDTTSESATAGFADLHFVAADAPCG